MARPPPSAREEKPTRASPRLRGVTVNQDDEANIATTGSPSNRSAASKGKKSKEKNKTDTKDTDGQENLQPNRFVPDDHRVLDSHEKKQLLAASRIARFHPPANLNGAVESDEDDVESEEDDQEPLQEDGSNSGEDIEEELPKEEKKIQKENEGATDDKLKKKKVPPLPDKVCLQAAPPVVLQAVLQAVPQAAPPVAPRVAGNRNRTRPRRQMIPTNWTQVLMQKLAAPRVAQKRRKRKRPQRTKIRTIWT